MLHLHPQARNFQMMEIHQLTPDKLKIQLMDMRPMEEWQSSQFGIRMGFFRCPPLWPSESAIVMAGLERVLIDMFGFPQCLLLDPTLTAFKYLITYFTGYSKNHARRWPDN